MTAASSLRVDSSGKLKPSDFHIPLLKILGRTTDLTPGATILSHDIRNNLFKEVGIDPSSLPPDEQRNIWRQVVYQNQYMHRQGKTPISLTAQGKHGHYGLTVEGVRQARGHLWEPKEYRSYLLQALSLDARSLQDVISDVLRAADLDPIPWAINRIKKSFELMSMRRCGLAVSVSRGQWALTTLGRYHALDQRGENITADWLQEHLGADFNGPLMRAIRSRISKKCRLSRKYSKVDDHAQQYFVRMIHRNAFRSRLLKGKQLSYSLVASWSVNSARHDIRDAGTEPVERTMYGAISGTEQKALKAQRKAQAQEQAPEPAPQMIHIIPDSRAVFGQDDHGDYRVMDIVDTQHTSDVMEERLHFERVWNRIETYLTRSTKAGELCVRVLRSRIEGQTLQWIADSEGLPKARVTKILKTARTALRRYPLAKGLF